MNKSRVKERYKLIMVNKEGIELLNKVLVRKLGKTVVIRCNFKKRG